MEKYLHFDLKAFVDSNQSFKWCPYPNCRVVIRKHRPNGNFDSNMTELIHNGHKSLDYYRSVDCCNVHYFSWDCLQEGNIFFLIYLTK
jgi:hypothetical protein